MLQWPTVNLNLWSLQLLAKIYKMPSKPVFLGARLASLPMRAQERSVSSEDGMDSVLAECDDDTGEPHPGNREKRASKKVASA